MKTKTNKSTAEKVSSGIIVAVVVLGTALFAAFTNNGSGLLTKLFIVFLGTIIALQVVPGVLLVAGMIRGACAGNRSLADGTDQKGSK